ncbi:MAG TPA: acyl carrier protein [Pelagibacterium sp.]|uniref:acyl carrier protein n=1 Tax=Pelagibacterium sp. TaxID=1967288 RepID=UPI002CDE3371|nr:acyl carrier protein [Pelagibacterium sp.]HWJ87748.1 acyl carrier protein [Pelagibacterium sp.]
MTAQDKIRSFIVENFLFGDADSMIENSGSLIENEILDSTAVLELVAFVEETFSVQVADTDIVPANLDSVDAIASFVAAKASDAAA